MGFLCVGRVLCVGCVHTSSSSGHSAGDGHTCLGQTPACRTHPKARLHLQAALHVKIIRSHPPILGYSQPWVPCDFPRSKGSGGRQEEGQGWGELPGPCSMLHTPRVHPGLRLFRPLSLPSLGRPGGKFGISPFISLGFSSRITARSGRTGWRYMGVSKD